MKLSFRLLFYFIFVVSLGSCDSESAGVINDETVSSELNIDYVYNNSEIETMNLINEYRLSIGLNSLDVINYASSKSDEHNEYMIKNKVVSHDGFVDRSNSIMQELKAKNVGENIAYNYQTSKAVLQAWLESPSHKSTIEGDYTHFGIGVKIDPETGKKYYTNIFVKI